jgi:4,5-dihydroxyphthalate decarboxylase
MDHFFHDMVTKLSYEIGEQAFAHYLIAKDQGKPLTAVPIFPSRFFPHPGLSVARGAGIHSPKDLEGKRVVVPDWGYNPGVWMRGILAHQYGVALETIHWLEDEREPLFHGLSYPRDSRYDVKKTAFPEAQRDRFHGMLALLESAEADAVIMASGGIPETAKTRKLFEDPYAEIGSYVSTTGVFPINTVVTLREDVVARHPGLPGRLMQGWREAAGLYRQAVERGDETEYMGLGIARLKEMGVFPSEHGIPQNRPAIELMVQYCHEQGLIRRRFEPEELFCDH